MKTVLVLFLISILVSCETKPKINVAVSSNMQYAITDIIDSFQKEYEFDVNLILGSSGKLTSQIEQGAPYDVFVSADLKHPNHLHNLGLINGTPKVYGNGQLILWTLTENEANIDSLELVDPIKIAIANPKHAPYGIAAIETIKKNKQYEAIKSHIVYGESISQCNQYITSKSVQFGFTSLSIVKSRQWTGIGKWELIDPILYSKIEQSAVVLKNSKQKVNANLFYNYLYSPKAKEILIRFGYLTPTYESSER